jgi:hypothetical protein
MAREERDLDSDLLPEPYPLTPEQRAAIMARLKADFSAADLQRFTEVEEDVPMEHLIEGIENLHHRRTRKSK